LAENTIVVLWGDHGWNLDEHDFWGKQNTLDNSLHAPLLDNPNQEWKRAVFGKWAKCEAVKTDHYLYAEWSTGGTVMDRMLFEHKNDPQENINIAEDPAML